MRSRFVASFLVALLSPLAFVAACATAQEISKEEGQRIVAVGDLHGDYEAYEEIMRNAGLIDSRGRWVGGDTILVQTGDIADRGPDSLKIIRHLQKLEKRARRNSGRIVTLVGNHEAMNMTNDLRYVHPGEYEAFATRRSNALRERVYENNREALEAFYLGEDPALTPEAVKAKWIAATPLGKLEHQSAWRADGEIGSWIVNNPAISVIDGNLFVHGGISAKYADRSVDMLNAEVAGALTNDVNESEAIINDELGPLWYRGLVSPPPALPADETSETPAETVGAPTPLTPEEEVDLVLEAFGVARIIVGHTPSLAGVKARHGGKVIQIDTGASAYYGGTRSFLEIRGDNLRANDNGEYRVIHGGAPVKDNQP